MLLWLMLSSCDKFEGHFYVPNEVKRVLPITNYGVGNVITFKRIENGEFIDRISFNVKENYINHRDVRSPVFLGSGGGLNYSEDYYSFKAYSKEGFSILISYASHDNVLLIKFDLGRGWKPVYDIIAREEDAITVDNVSYRHIFRIENKNSPTMTFGYLSNEKGFIKLFFSDSFELDGTN